MVDRQALALDAGADAAHALGEAATVRGELFRPAGDARLLMVCLPGGGMNRHYFDLPTPEGEVEASFARAMLARGFAVALLDPVGIGDSSEPADPYRITPDVQAAALAEAVKALQARTGLRSVGVGHSFGAALSLAVQARQPLHAGLALFGFGVPPIAGLSTPPEAELGPEKARAGISAGARRRYPEPYLSIPPMKGSRAAMLTRANDRLLATGAYSTLLPNLFAPDAAAVSAPLLIAMGDKDMHGDPRLAIRHYPAANDIDLVVLPDTRHNHFVYPSRTRLFERVAHWATAL